MKRFIFLLFSLSILAGLSCKSIDVKYIAIGDEYDPLPDYKQVKLLLSSYPKSRYEEIGILRLEGGSERDRIKIAKKHAREKGGHGIIPLDIETETKPKSGLSIGAGVSDGDMSQSPGQKKKGRKVEVQEFLIVRVFSKIDGPEAKKKGKLEVSGNTNDYSSIKRASYKQLINDYKSIRDEKFRGKLIPRKIYNIPARLRKFAEKKDKIVLLSTKSGKAKLLLIIPENIQNRIKKMIKSKKSLDFIYSPVSVYKTKKGKRPVLKYINEIRN